VRGPPKVITNLIQSVNELIISRHYHSGSVGACDRRIDSTYAPREIADEVAMYYKRDFWSKENLKFTTQNYRLRNAVGVVNKIAGDRQCDLLDIGCGPAALQDVLRENISYFGIDIAIHDPAPNLIESDFLESPISFQGKKFDIIVVQGVFEYMGKFQEQKFAEINDLLKPDGRLVVTYVLQSQSAEFLLAVQQYPADS
jgi:cyclopropane fatty-acyl-phospholipid synthase-like methyltransferase